LNLKSSTFRKPFWYKNKTILSSDERNVKDLKDVCQSDFLSELSKKCTPEYFQNKKKATAVFVVSCKQYKS